jgi:hypothetical protein
MPKYENAVVYKLCCDDPEITDIYVGSTCNFKMRKWNHKSSCCNPNDYKHNLYVYQFIRENGGWDAWSMILIKKYPHVVDNQELLMKERKWITRLKATLNKQLPNRTKNEWKMDNKEYIKAYQLEKIKCDCGCMIHRKHISRHRKSKKHQDKMNNLPQ